MKKALVVIACGLGLGLIPTQASAADIILSYDPVSTDTFVGAIIDDIPSNPADELGYIADLIAVPILTKDNIGTTDYLGDTDTGQTEIYDRTLSTLTPLKPIFEFLAKRDGSDNTWESPYAGWLYVLGKYDAAKAGGLVFLVHVENSGDVITLPTEFNGHGLSHIGLFSTTEGLECVPDGGATLMLLGGALVALGALRRRFLA